MSILISRLAIVLTCLVLASCARGAGADPKIDQLLPAGAVKAEIPPSIDHNQSTPKGNVGWIQGFKSEATFEQEIADLQYKLTPLGYSLEDNTHYRDTLGDTGARNADVLRIYRGRGRSVGLYCFNGLKGWSPEYANYAIMFRLY